MINWTDPKCNITPNFTVKEALWLPHWNRLANGDDGVTEEVRHNLLSLCNILEELRRDVLVHPIHVHSMFRSEDYNRLILKLELFRDVHTFGKAVDFHTVSTEPSDIEAVKTLLRPMLNTYNIRLEGNTTTWIHLDTYRVGPSGREFKG